MVTTRQILRHDYYSRVFLAFIVIGFVMHYTSLIQTGP